MSRLRTGIIVSRLLHVTIVTVSEAIVTDLGEIHSSRGFLLKVHEGVFLPAEKIYIRANKS